MYFQSRSRPHGIDDIITNFGTSTKNGINPGNLEINPGIESRTDSIAFVVESIFWIVVVVDVDERISFVVCSKAGGDADPDFKAKNFKAKTSKP